MTAAYRHAVVDGITILYREAAQFFETGHFALETHARDIGAGIGAFRARHVQ